LAELRATPQPTSLVQAFRPHRGLPSLGSLASTKVGDGVDETTWALRERTGLDIVGCYAFGSGPAHADELLAFVARGTKRATTAALLELAQLDHPLPAVGQLWGLLDGAGVPRFVAETVDVVPGRLDEVTPAFAWDEGEDDGTLESWQKGHRGWGLQLGVADPDRLEVLFERFRVIWPQRDRTVWLADSVRELRFDERPSLRDALLARHGLVELHGHGERWPIDALPALVCERGGERVGTLSFRPRPAREAVVFAPDAFDDNIEAGLRQALTELGHHHGWDRIVAPDGAIEPLDR
jgi:uncharacterized protein YhfF